NYTIALVYEKNSKSIYQILVQSTIPNVVEELKQNVKNLVQLGVENESSKVTEKSSDTLEQVYQHKDYILIIKNTRILKKPIATPDGPMIGQYSINIRTK